MEGGEGIWRGMLSRAPSSPPAPQPDVTSVVSIERIRRRLNRPPAIVLPLTRRPGVPLFRVSVTQKLLLSGQTWDEQVFRSAFVRPRQQPVHFEFVSQVTPEPYRASTLYPVGIPVVPIVEELHSTIKGAIRSYREKRARRQVEEELRAFKAATAARSR